MVTVIQLQNKLSYSLWAESCVLYWHSLGSFPGGEACCLVGRLSGILQEKATQPTNEYSFGQLYEWANFRNSSWSPAQSFRWQGLQPASFLDLYEGPRASDQLSQTQLSDPQKLSVIVSVCWFDMLSFRVVCPPKLDSTIHIPQPEAQRSHSYYMEDCGPGLET